MQKEQLSVSNNFFQTFEDLSENDIVTSIIGNPNVGKSSIFNLLTGLNQHTGNWPGKTVSHAIGYFTHYSKNIALVDLPGTYSLTPHSIEEQVSRNYLCFGKSDVAVVVCDATTIEKSLNLVMQVLQITNKVVVCVNLIDQAQKKKIEIDFEQLESILGVPVVATNGRTGDGLLELKDAIVKMSNIEDSEINHLEYDEKIEKSIEILSSYNKLYNRFFCTNFLCDDTQYIDLFRKYNPETGDDEEFLSQLEIQRKILIDKFENIENLRDKIVVTSVKKSEEIYQKVVKDNKRDDSFDRKLDKIFTSKLTGIPIMIIMMSFIFFITIYAANYPSQLLSSMFDKFGIYIRQLLEITNLPYWITSPLMDGVYSVLTWVISVMLPPMAIFFPLFTLLEDFGYLPRVAFNLDHCFHKCQTCGKQSLCMAMGFGCNAAGVIGCRIIDSPRERLIAIITNNFVPCNGRFPTIIAIISMFFAVGFSRTCTSYISALILTSIIIFSVIMTLIVSFVLSKTLLKGQASSFTLELPSYRPPKIKSVIVRSIFDRTLFVLFRAIKVAAPAGLIIWILANIEVGDATMLKHLTSFFDPLGKLMGLDGVILMAFILGFPANEIVLPIILMSYLNIGTLSTMSDFTSIFQLLSENGWTAVTGVCFILFSLMHFPCSTTLLTIKKETQSPKWTFVSFLVPTVIGFVLCCLVNLVL